MVGQLVADMFIQVFIERRDGYYKWVVTVKLFL